MKIYGNTTDNTKFDQFIGKDIWVKCKYAFNDTEEYYIRFLRQHERCLYVMDINVNYYNGLCNYWRDRGPAIIRPHTDVRTFNAEDIQIIEPLETYTTSQLFGQFSTEVASDKYTDNIFDRFAGKDFWILVTKFDESEWSYYINIIDKVGDTIFYNIVDAEYVHNPEISEESYGPPTEDPNVNSYRQVSLAGIWRVVQPLDGLSGEEIDEALDTCDEIWEKFHIDDAYDDEDEEYEDYEEFDGNDEDSI